MFENFYNSKFSSKNSETSLSHHPRGCYKPFAEGMPISCPGHCSLKCQLSLSRVWGL